MKSNTDQRDKALRDAIGEVILTPHHGVTSQRVLSPQQLMVLSYQWNYDINEENSSLGDYIRDPEIALLDLYILGVLPPLPEEKLTTAMFLSDQKIIFDDRVSILWVIAALSGFVELSTADEERLEIAMEKWNDVWEVEQEIIAQGLSYTEQEVELLHGMHMDTAAAFYAFTERPVPKDEAEIKKLLLPMVGESHRGSRHLSDASIIRNIGWRSTSGVIDLFCALEEWGEKHICSETHDNIVGKAYGETKEHLLRLHGEKALLSLVNLGGVLKDQAPEFIAEHLLPHVTSMTWGKLIYLGNLTGEYNIEWALAAMEWNDTGTTDSQRGTVQ